MFYSLFLAQEGSEAAASILQQSLELSKGTVQAWQETWISVFDPSDMTGMWSAMIETSKVIAGFCLLYMAVKSGSELLSSQSIGKVVEMLSFPIATVLLLNGNGKFLAYITLAIREVGYFVVRSVTERQVMGVRLEIATEQLKRNNIGVQRINQLYGECISYVGEELTTCWQSKGAEGEAIINALEKTSSVDMSPARAFAETAMLLGTQADGTIGTLSDVGTGLKGIASFFQGGFSEVVQDQAFPVIQAVLYALQWAFVNMSEAALLITAVLAPIALVMSILPTAGRPIFIWGSAMVSILGMQLGYNLVVGIVATVLINTEGNVVEVASNLGFLAFASLFAPLFATAGATWGGAAMFSSISRRANAIAAVATGGISAIIGGFRKT